MNIESNLSGHWTDEQLIEHLYGIGPEGEHLESCEPCRERLSQMGAARHAIEAEFSPAEQVAVELVAAQRRSIYRRIAQIPSSQLGLKVRGWAAAAAMIVLLGGGAYVYEQNQDQRVAQSRLTDAQLAQEVSAIAQDSEPSPTAPLQQLFVE
jgi:predicted anti-sigma-YlaC factor YlaD